MGGTITLNTNNDLLVDLPGLTLNGPTTIANTTGGDALSINGTIAGTGPLTLSSTNRHDGLQLNAASSYTGATIIAGTSRVLINADGGIPSTSALTVNAGASARFAQPNTVASLNGAGNIEITGTFTVGGDNTSTAYTGVIAGSSDFTKTGAGTLTLSDAHTYTGNTLVSAGTLTVNGSLGAESTVTVASGATLNGTGTINGDVALQSGATLGTGLTVNGTIAAADTDVTVGNASQLRAAILGATDGKTITFGADITLTADLPAVQADVTIDGDNHTLSGDGQFRGLFIGAFSGSTQVAVSVTVQNLTIANALAKGGDAIGDAAGGGGAGLGGALFVAQSANVTLIDVSLIDSAANGGNGDMGTDSGGGGGGMGGDGGRIDGPGNNRGTYAGGGGLGRGATGGTSGPTAMSGDEGIAIGAASGGESYFIGGGGAAGGLHGGGGAGARNVANGGAGGGGVGGGAGDVNSAGGAGGFGGGGGAGSVGGNGGFGGGGGYSHTGAAGAGGFGGGGGGSFQGTAGPGGFGGGNGSAGLIGGGGAGAGMGGAIFVQEGGSLNVSGALTINGNTVSGGAGFNGGGNGSAFGSGIFVQGDGAITFSPAVGQTQTVADVIADQTGSGGAGGDAGVGALVKDGAGTLVLTGANTYTGATTVSAGTLTVNGSLAAGTTITIAAGATLTGTGTINGNVLIQTGGTLDGGLIVNGTATLAPVITSGTTAGGSYGAAMTPYTITASNNPTVFSITAGPLPGGVTLDTDSGVISGTPTETGTFNVTVGATNAAGTGTQALAITVNAKALTVTGLAANNKTYNGSASATVVGTGSLVGVVGADDVTLTGTPIGAFADSEAGSNKTVTVSGLSLLGADAGRYTLSSPTLAANISAASGWVTLSDLRQTYDGTPKAVGTSTDPGGLGVTVLYNGSTTEPTAAGTYFVEAMIGDGNYTGSTTRTLVVLPAIATPPARTSAAPGGAAMFAVVANGGRPLTYQWKRNGVDIPGATSATLALANVRGSDVGLYSVAVSAGAAAITTPAASLELEFEGKLAGNGVEVDTDVRHPNGNIYDQVLLTGTSVSVKADPGQITRVSFVDLTDDIVQVEFFGAGILSVSLKNASGPAAPANYNQPGVNYMKGHATVSLTGADATTHLGIYSVGPLTAYNQALFRAATDYDGWADIALLTIESPSGEFARVGSGNAYYFDTSGLTGIYAPDVHFKKQVAIGNITAADTASGMLVFGDVRDIRITGGDLFQENDRPVEVAGIAWLSFTAGTSSHSVLIAAQANRARLVRNGVDLTDQIAPRP